MRQVSGLTASTEYSIEVAAVNSAGTGVYSNAIMQLTQVEAPVLSVVGSTTATTISLSWTSAGSVVTSYEVMWQRDTSGDCPDEDEGSMSITDGSTSYMITGLEEDSSYSITVEAVNSIGMAISNTATGMTQDAVPTAAPTNVGTSSDTFSSITVQWGAVNCIHRNGDITDYLVRYGVQGSGVGDRTVEMASGDSSGGMYQISGLSASTEYTIEVAAVNNAGTGDYSTLKNQLTLVQAPVVTVGSSVTATSLPVSWTSAGSVVTSYEVEWTSGDCPAVDGGSAIVTGSTTSYTIEDLEEYITYSITVNASNAVGSAVSEPDTGRTSEASPSAAPTSVIASSTSNSITVQWEAVNCIHRNGDITGYTVRYGVQGNGSTQTASVSGGGATTRLISGLESSTNYSVEVAAVNSAGTGVYSDPYITLTDSGLSATAPSLTTNSIFIRWTVIAGITPAGYIISYANTDNTECFTDSDTMTGIAASADDYNIQGLEEGTEYTVTVTLSREGGGTDVDTVTATTLDAAPSAAPTSVSVSEVTSSGITVQWGAVNCIHRNGDITGYSVRYGVQGSGSTQTVSVSGGGATMTTISGLTPSTNYSIEVAAVNSAGTGMYSDAVADLTLVQSPVLSLPSPAEAFTVSLSWTSAGSVVDSYEVMWQRDTSGDCPDEDEGSMLVPGGSTSYMITGLAGVSSYTITVTATNAAGSAASEPLTVMTTGAAPSASPTSITASDVIPNSFTVQWGAVNCTDRNGDITGYSVRYGVQGNESTQTVSVSGPGTMDIDISGLTADTSYAVEVAAENADGIGVYSDPLTVDTPQTVYLNFGGENLPTNGYVAISALGSTEDTALVCRTDQPVEGDNITGGWFNPNGTMIEFDASSSQGFYSSGGSGGIRLLRGTGIPVEGIYTCRTADGSSTTQTVFVGLYNEGGGILMVEDEIEFSLDSEPVAANPQFTLTCISTGGPATTVTWTRDLTVLEDNDAYLQKTVLDNAENATYTHTLNVTGRLGGDYQCTVSNNIPSEDNASITLEVASAPSNLMAVQEGPTSVRVSWSLPTPPGDTTGYRISYSGGSSGSVDISNGSTNNYLLTGLQSGASYTISIVGTSLHLPSDPLSQSIELVIAPEKPEVSVDGTTGSTVSLSWQSSGSVVDSYEVMWQASTAGSAPDSTVLFGSTSYTITELEEGTDYSITVTATNAAGSAVSDTISASTPEATASSSIAVIAGAAGGGGALAILLVVLLLIVLCVVCKGRSKQKKYRPRKFDSKMYSNATLTSHPTETDQYIKTSGTVLANESATPLYSREAESVIYDNLIAPAIVQFPEEMSAVEGERVIFRVEVTGSPHPKLTWYHNGEEVVADYSRELAENGSLTMPSAEAKHSGVYQLVAQSPAGRREREVKLSVEADDEKEVEGTPQPLEGSTAIPVAMFGNHVESNHARQNQAFKDDYQVLYNGDDKSTTIALSPDNKTKNRFLNICVYDDHRVLLRPLEGHEDCQSDYINASYIDGYSQPAKFLATQGPLPKTVVDFWRMVWQEKAPTIVMITNLVEGTKTKCHQYWPDKDSEKFGPFEVSIIDQQILADYTIRTLVLQLTGSFEHSLRVTQFHFTAWPDHGVPDYATPILAFHRRVIRAHQPDKGPIMVHCSAGVGRTGTFITIDHILEQVGRKGVVDIPGAINKIRRQRMKLVQTVDQYILIHDAILESVTCGDTQITSNNVRYAMKKLGDAGFSYQFSVLEQVSPRSEEVKAEIADKNPNRNRSTDFPPADKWRVTLRDEHPDYIHAVHVNGYKQQRAFIIAQGPMQSTARDFWKMIHDRKCGVVVMLSDLVEAGKEVCYQYWPSSGSHTYGEFTVEILGEEKQMGFVLRNFNVTHSESGRVQQVSQFHITNWAPDGRCSNLASVTSVIDEMSKVQRRTGNHPIVVHCSDTVSRSGMFCAITTTIERCKTEGVVDVFQVVKALRVQKPGAVRTVTQYQIIFDAVLTFLDSFDTYANF